MTPSAFPKSTESFDKELEAKLRTLGAEVVSAGLSPSEFMPPFRRLLLETPDPARAINNFLRYIASGFSSSLLRDFAANPVLLGVALTLFSHSQYLADILVRSPELFHWLTATPALMEKRTGDNYREDAINAITPFERTDSRLDALKRFQRREILRISAKDILKEADLRAVTRELAWLADAIVHAVLTIGLEDLNRRLASKIPSTFCVLGLGKLGGTELNFSSDIDLMFVYDEDDDLDFGAERIHSFHEYYCRLAEFVVRRLSEQTEEGHLYRTDMRLRPDGAVGPLAMSRSSYLHYYETRGELWERQMLLKARIVAGDEGTGTKFLNDLRPFVYPSTVLYDPREEILAIKTRIESRLRETTNVKLSKGGIRDIEFIVQALQLLWAPANVGLRESNTLAAIDKLRDASLLSRTEALHLEEGYTFLRNVEHRLQLLHGTQTHELPVNAEELRLLCLRLGLKSTKALEAELVRVRTQVRTIYDSVFLEHHERRTTSVAGVGVSKTDIKRMLSARGFVNTTTAVDCAEEIIRNIAQLNNAKHLARLFTMLQHHGAPDAGLANLRNLASSQSLARSFDQILARKKMLDLLLTVCSRSKRLTQLLTAEPLLLETFLGRPEEIVGPGLEWEFFLKENPVKFRLFNDARTAIRYLLGITNIRQATREFTATADAVVHSIVEDLCSRLPDFAEQMCIVAMGKYGGEELMPGSDLDLLIVTTGKEGPTSSPGAEAMAVEMIRAFKSPVGQIYSVDLRLRPEGGSAPVTADLSYYAGYLRDRADLWEKQALLRARVVTGPESLGREFERLKKETLTRVTGEPDWTGKILLMKRKMELERGSDRTRRYDLKTARGGLVDLEFLLQAVQLKSYSSLKSTELANSFQAMDRLLKRKMLRKSHYAVLKKNYEFLRGLELMIRLNSGTTEFVLMEDETLKQAVAAGIRERTSRDLGKKITRVRKENRHLMMRVFKELRQ